MPSSLVLGQGWHCGQRTPTPGDTCSQLDCEADLMFEWIFFLRVLATPGPNDFVDCGPTTQGFRRKKRGVTDYGIICDSEGGGPRSHGPVPKRVH